MAAMKPRHYQEWPDLARAAEKLLADRIEGDARAIEAGKLTAAQGADRERIARTIASQVRALADHTPIPEREAWDYEIRADLTAVVAGAAARARRAPDTVVMRDSFGEPVAAALFAEYIAAIAWWFEPWTPELRTSRLEIIHEANRAHRARPDRRSRAA